MGTTLTLAYVLWPDLHIGHVGDSRCYRIRDSAAEQLTRDHTYAQQLVEAGILTAEQAAESRWGSALWNAIGGECEELRPDVIRETLESGDALVLCTDGLSGHVPPEEIAQFWSMECSYVLHVDTVSEHLLDELRSWQGVLGATLLSSSAVRCTLRIALEDAGLEIADIVAELVRSGVRVEACYPEQPPLYDAFTHFTERGSVR